MHPIYIALGTAAAHISLYVIVCAVQFGPIPASARSYHSSDPIPSGVYPIMYSDTSNTQSADLYFDVAAGNIIPGVWSQRVKVDAYRAVPYSMERAAQSLYMYGQTGEKHGRAGKRLYGSRPRRSFASSVFCKACISVSCDVPHDHMSRHVLPHV